MRYPILTRSKTEALARQLVSSQHTPNWELERSWVGSGQEVDLKSLGKVMGAMHEAFEQRDPKR